MNDWNIRSFLIVVFTIYLAYISSVFLSTLGFSIPYLQQVTGIFLLLFAPGFLLLRILRLHALGTVETVVYTVGLSISVMMFMGFFTNLVYPIFWINKPLSFPCLLRAISFILLVFGLLSFLRDRDYNSPCILDLQHFVAPISLLIYIIPCLSIIGSFLIGRDHNNTLSLASIILIAILVLCFAYKKQGYSSPIDILFIFSVSISLLLGDLLISEYPRRLNVDKEFYFLNQVVENGYWDFSLFGSANTLLSIVALGTTFSEIMGINLFVVLKVIYPLIFTIVPIALYTAYKREFSNKLSLFAVLFFMFNYYFFTEALILRRQQVAFFFVALLLLLFTEKNVATKNSSPLYLFFTMALVTSHYTVSLNWIIIVILLASIYFLMHAKPTYKNKFCRTFQQRKSNKEITSYEQKIALWKVVFLCVFFLGWYMYVNISVFTNLVELGNNILDNFMFFLDPSSKHPAVSSALGVGFWGSPTLNKVYRLLQYAGQGLIIIGLLDDILAKGLQKLTVCLRFAAVIFLLLAITLPFLSFSQSVPRLYFFTLLFLSPCCIDGAHRLYYSFCQLHQYTIKYAPSIIKHWSVNYQGRFVPLCSGDRVLYTLLAILVLIPFFLFNVGLVFEFGGFTEETRLTARIPSSSVLSYGKIDTEYHLAGEVMLGLEIPRYLDKDAQVYADTWVGYDIVSAWHDKTYYFPNDLRIPNNSYIFLRSWNINHHSLVAPVDNPPKKFHYVDISRLSLQKRNFLYDNGYAALYGGAGVVT